MSLSCSLWPILPIASPYRVYGFIESNGCSDLPLNALAGSTPNKLHTVGGISIKDTEVSIVVALNDLS